MSNQTRSNPTILAGRGLALLENGSGADNGQQLLQAAERDFEELAQRFPDDPLGIQNLCITLLVHLKQVDRTTQPQAFDSLRARLNRALIQLEKLTPDEPIADVLAARQHLLAGEVPQAIDRYRAATQRAHAGPATYFELYMQLKAAEDPAAVGSAYQDEEGKALKAALDLTPGNLALSVEWLRHLAQIHSDKLIGYIAQCRDLFLPLTSRTSSVIPKLMDTATQAAQEGNWPTAIQQTNFLRNVAVAEIAFQHALHLLEPHELEFVRLQFTQQTQQAIAQDAPQPSAARPLTALRLVEQGRLDQLGAGHTAIAAEDFDLDGHDDLWTIAGKNLRILDFSKPIEIELLCDFELSITGSGMALADFDRDFQHRKDELPASALPTTAAPEAGEESGKAPQLTPQQMVEKYLDTDLDLVVFGAEGVRLYRNDVDPDSGQRTWTEMPQPGIAELSNVRSVAVIDFDHDSDLDLVISSDSGISLWSNRGDWSFADFTTFSQLPPPQLSVTDILALDADRNVLNDFLLASEETAESLLLKSNLHGRYFRQADPWTETGFGGQRSLEAIDANADACWDVIGCGRDGVSLTLMQSTGRHSWIPAARRMLSTQPMRDLLVADFDNDGRDDCVAWGASGIEFFRPDAQGQLNRDPRVVSYSTDTLQVVALDLDRDGDLDLTCLDNDGKLQLLENEGGNANQHLELVIRADEDGKQRPRERTNMHGVGSLVELKAGEIYQSRIVRGTRTRFGLGQRDSADVLRVVWTNGIPNNVLDISHQATVYDQQNLGGSCPYLYAWNGTRFEFCTDCLWAAPIGLQFAQGQAAPSREWEYLRIDGRSLQPLDDQYVLQMTEELWEAAYFDSIQLLAVDHPPEVEIYTNEKVGPAELAEFKLHVVRQKKSPQRVLDPRGRELSEVIATRDGRFTKTWEQGLNQGLTDEHWLEIDFGPLANPDNVHLFLTGWLFPTSTSINLSMAENPLKPALKPPSIWMPNAQGEWLEVIPYAGFPGGKTKTIVLDLSNQFLCDDYRIRLVSNMELCWDEVFFTDTPPTKAHASDTPPQPEPPVQAGLDYRLHPQPLLTADLHYRGFSRLVPQPYHAPKRFDYEQASQPSIWPPMQGAFTRYGDVTPLIRNADDLQVVLGAGDEMTLRFQATQLPLPTGWVRDFVLYNIGWDKDADLNTIHGQSVEPLPFRGMRQYPYAPDQSFPDTPAHREFLRSYQTRRQSSAEFWNQIRDANSAL